ncbi:MAG: hypothetical protein MUF54_26045 [Polyangiaceae bacterium]|nr:hypothetical protein [Polyangiaceae bacterium]
MGNGLFSEHADRARRGQWRIPDLPWDEPVRYCGESRRERTICKLDMLEVSEAMYHFQLGARARMGDYMVLSWDRDSAFLECLEWHDTDEIRHLRGLRRLIEALRQSGDDLPAAKKKPPPSHLWNVARSSPDSWDTNALLVDLLVDEAASRALYAAVARRSHVPLVRAVFAACGEDDMRHEEYMLTFLRARLAHRRLLTLQMRAVAHVALLQSAYRPYYASFAGATHSTRESVAIELFRAASRVLGELGPAWKKLPPARVLHAADRSPWLLWLLR